MVSKIAVMGSCATRDVFNSTINPNYKDFFQIVSNISRTTFISLMSNPIDIPDESLIKIYTEGKYDHFRTKNFEKDLTKSFLDELKNNNIDYLIIDNLFESRFGILCSDEKIMTNNTWDLHQTKYFTTLENINTLSMKDNPNEYFKLFKESCNLFFDYVDDNCNFNVILHKASDSDRFLKEDGSIEIYDFSTEYCNEVNPFTYKFNKYIEDNFEVDVIELNIVNYPNDVNHIWGLGTSHYIPEYYQDFTKKLNILIKQNNNNVLLNKIINSQKNEILELKKIIDQNCKINGTPFMLNEYGDLK